ncbi:hypothetical protein MKW92_028889 [Papaver armeniacum]|nr:hypothetical protein MKW92_028889 [Papaver armeniacum]
MASCIYNYFLRVFSTNSESTCHEQPSSSAKDETHYQHGIPGIPTDGKVVLLRNSSNGAQLYLVGTVHVSKQSAETVKKVIDYVRPDVVAVELCKRSASRYEGLVNWKPEEDTLYKLFRKSMRAPGGLCMKIYIFILNCRSRRLDADGILSGLEFKVAIEESSRVGARCFYIDQDIGVTCQQLSKASTFGLLWKANRDYRLSVHTDLVHEKYTRSFVREISGIQKNVSKVIIEDRDKFMFTNLRNFQGKVVAVVGMAHMDGIELLWKTAEENNYSSIC